MFGYKVAEQFGLSIIPTTAGLVPFTLHKADKEDFAELSGIAVPAEITAQDGTLFKEALFLIAKEKRLLFKSKSKQFRYKKSQYP